MRGIVRWAGRSELQTNVLVSLKPFKNICIECITLTPRVPAAPRGWRTASLQSPAPLRNVKPRPGCNLPQTLRKLILFLLRSLLLKHSGRGDKPSLLTSRGGGKRRPGGLSPCRRPPSSPPCPCPPRCLRCPLRLCGKLREAAENCGKLRAALRWGAGKLQSRFSAARLCIGAACGADPSQPHALLPTRRSRLLLCLHHPLPLAMGSTPSSGHPRLSDGACRQQCARPSPVRGAR